MAFVASKFTQLASEYHLIGKIDIYKGACLSVQYDDMNERYCVTLTSYFWVNKNIRSVLFFFKIN